MAEITLARTCPSKSMAPVQAIIKLVAADCKISGLTPLERVRNRIATGPHRAE